MLFTCNTMSNSCNLAKKDDSKNVFFTGIPQVFHRLQEFNIVLQENNRFEMIAKTFFYRYSTGFPQVTGIQHLKQESNRFNNRLFSCNTCRIPVVRRHIKT